MKNIEKRKKTEYCEKSNKINKYIFTFTFSCGKKYILLENILEKKIFFLLNLHYNLFTWQVIGNAVIK